MKKYVITILAVLLLPFCSEVLCGRSFNVLALTGREQAYLDNLTSDGTQENANSEVDHLNPPADDDWFLSRMRRFAWFYYGPDYPDYYPYADPYTAAYGYPWRYYYDDYLDRDGYEHHGRSGSDLSQAMANMRRRRQVLRENVQSFMLERRENRCERFEKIRDGLQDMFSRDLNFGRYDNRRNDLDSRLPCREQRGVGFRGGRH